MPAIPLALSIHLYCGDLRLRRRVEKRGKTFHESDFSFAWKLVFHHLSRLIFANIFIGFSSCLSSSGLYSLQCGSCGETSANAYGRCRDDVKQRNKYHSKRFSDFLIYAVVMKNYGIVSLVRSDAVILTWQFDWVKIYLFLDYVTVCENAAIYTHFIVHHIVAPRSRLQTSLPVACLEPLWVRKERGRR